MVVTTVRPCAQETFSHHQRWHASPANISLLESTDQAAFRAHGAISRVLEVHSAGASFRNDDPC